jgi:protein gp37
MSTKIEWAQESWNPIIGCSKVSEGCKNCYAERQAYRLANMGHVEYGLVVNTRQRLIDEDAGTWNGKTVLVESIIEKPLNWKRPRRVFVCSMGDLFHESVPFEWIDQVFAVMALCRQHVFMLLTKRPERMQTYILGQDFRGIAQQAAQLVENSDYHYDAIIDDYKRAGRCMKNVWLGVTAENQEASDERIPTLLQIPAAKRFVSVEPMLRPVDLKRIDYKGRDGSTRAFFDALTGQIAVIGKCLDGNKLDWVICGGESGPGARPMDPAWMRDLRDQCVLAGVPFFFKQWGGVNKKKAGRVLDGQTWEEYPE